MRSKLLRLAAGFCILLLAGAGAAKAQSGDVEIKDAWARATPGGAKVGAVYLTLLSPAGDRLTGVATPAAAKAEIHSATMDGGVMKMRQVDGVELPAGQAVALKPGGYHIMLMDLAQPLKEGQNVSLTLTFANAGPRQVTAAIERAGAMGPANASGNMHGGMDMPAHR